MSASKALNALFTEWQRVCDMPANDFYADGIINESLYASSSSRLLVIAKEPNARNHDQTGDRSFVTEWDSRKGRYRFALRIGEWAHGILHDFPPFDVFKEEDKLDSLRKIAFMNVKKSGGVGSANRDDIYQLVCKHREFITEEIRIIDPDIILLGLSFDKRLATELFGPLDWQPSGYSIDVAPLGKARIIDFYHPSSRNVGAAAYSLLQNVIRSMTFRNLLTRPGGN